MSTVADDLRSLPVHQILDWQVDLIRWWRSEKGRTFAKGYVASESATTGLFAGQDERLADHLAESLDRAATYWVVRSMEEQVIALAREQALPPVVEPHDLPSPHGFVVFDDPVEVIDVHGMVMTWRALQWSPVKSHTLNANGEFGDGVLVCGYGDVIQDQQLGLDEYFARQPEIATNFGNRFVLSTASAFTFGEPARVSEEVLEHGPSTALAAQAFWMLSQQRIAVKTGAHVPRHTVRRWQRAGDRSEIPEVIVIALRRGSDLPASPLDEDEDSPSSVLWSHRWYVRGHWRRQPIGKRGSGQWKWTWIDGHIRGPENLPYIEKDAVAKLYR